MFNAHLMDLLNEPRPDVAVLPRVNLPISITFCEYDRTRPIADGTVKLAGLEPTFTVQEGWNFCLRPVYEEYDIAEMSFSWYIMARDRGEPVKALPIFPLRMPPLSHIYVRTDSPYRVPADLRGCRVASEAYRLTVNLWLRGMCSEFYGLQPQDVEWFSSLVDEGAGYALPDGVVLHLDAGDPQQLLLEGKVDALFLPNAPDAVNAGDPRIRRLFADHQAENEAYYRRQGGVPMTHVLVARESLLEREPWIVRNLLDAFSEAQTIVDRAYRKPKYLSVPGALEALERQRRVLGTRPMYTHGLDGNRDLIEAFVRYGCEQGYTSRVLSTDELFAAV
jgi:4,5-dihydroxyphthalate decarboxylase